MTIIDLSHRSKSGKLGYIITSHTLVNKEMWPLTKIKSTQIMDYL
jgi:hypothetical protein